MATNPTSLGPISVSAGTRARVTTTRTPCQAFMVQALPSNTQVGSVGDSTLVHTTGVGAMGYIGIPTTTVIPAFSARHAFAPGAFNLADIYLDCASGTQTFIVVYVQ